MRKNKKKFDYNIFLEPPQERVSLGSIVIKQNVDIFKSLHARVKTTSDRIPNLTNEFLESLKMKIPEDVSKTDRVSVHNIHIYGGPGVGKSTLARTIGYHITKIYGPENVCCIESNFLPTAVESIDPSKKVFVLHIDDPMAEQDAREPMSEGVRAAGRYFNEIRHIIARKIVEYKLKKYLETDELPDRLQKLIRLEAWNELREEFPDHVIFANAIIFTIFGPQTPEIDQRLHQSKLWNIYKGLGSLDEKRKKRLEDILGKRYMELLGKYERLWRHGYRKYQSYSIIVDPLTNRKGLLIMYPKPSPFTRVEKGEEHAIGEIKEIATRADKWAEFIYHNRYSLNPPYNVFNTQQMRYMSLRNFIRDTLKQDFNPIENRRLSTDERAFLKKMLKHVGILDDRIVKYYSSQGEEEKIQLIASYIVEKLEEHNIKPKGELAKQLMRAIARKAFKGEDILNKTGVWKRIQDEVILQWFDRHPEDFIQQQKKEQYDAEPMVTKETITTATETKQSEDTIRAEFNIKIEDIIADIVRRDPSKESYAKIYILTEGLQGEKLRHKDIAEESLELLGEQITVETSKWRKKKFAGLLAREMGFAFEQWLQKIISEGFEIKNVLENVEEIQRFGGTSEPDLVCKHKDGSYTVISAKCLCSTRSETFDRKDFLPEIKYLEKLKNAGHEARLLIIYRNIGIPGLLAYREFKDPEDVPPNVTFAPSEANKTFFEKKVNKV